MGSPPPAIDRTSVLQFRWHRHRLDAAAGSMGDGADLPLLDLGVQDTGPDGAGWALLQRGVDPKAADLALAWTLRGAPHAYRRGDLRAVAVATAPWSEADAAKRIFDAAKPLKAAGMPVLDALRTIADHLRSLAAEPLVKGDASGALNDLLPEPFLRTCRPCKAVHIYELPFRLAALQAGLELEAGTSPPVLRRVPGLRPNLLRHLGAEAEPRHDVVRGVLRCWGPATPKEVATFLDTTVQEVRSRWPEDAVEVEVEADGDERRPAWVLAEDLDELLSPSEPGGGVRLLGPYDPYLQGRDRSLLVPEPERRAALWPVLGRPGAVALDGEVVGLWRPRSRARRLDLEVEPWTDLAPHRDGIEAAHARLAALRGKEPGAIRIGEEQA